MKKAIKKYLLSLVLVLCFVSHIAYGAISGSAVWDIRSTATAANANGCFFVTGATGTNYSEQNAAQFNLTGVTTTAASATLLSTSASTDMVGNGTHITAGTNFITGWYEIVSVVAGVSLTVDRTATTAAGTGGVVNIGGACSLGSADDAVFESFTAGNNFYIKGSATYTLGGVVSIAAAGTTTNPIMGWGYDSVHGDAPTGSTRPILDQGANNFTSGANWEWAYIQSTSTSISGFLFGSANKFYFTKHMNTSTTAGRTALGVSVGTAVSLIGVEAWSIRGFGVRGNSTTNNYTIVGSYFHDSDVCLSDGSSTANTVLVNSIIEGCVTTGFSFTNTKTGWGLVYGNTFYGSENKDRGTAVDFVTGTTNGPRLLNNIYYGWTKALNSTDDLTKIAISDFQDFFNNTTNRTNISAGGSDFAADPGFKNVAQVTVTTATTSNTGNTLTKAGATFSTSGVVAGRDFVYISSTSGTVGLYTISSVDSETQLTLGQAPGNSTANVTASINVKHDFGVGLNVRTKATPKTFPAGFTISYPNVGAVQSMPGFPKKVGER